ncbi:FAD-dependent oxidoreductase [Sulfitobacter sp. 1A12126]|jgi:monoamine oxidase|uniref:FAD-dependent oxidoreductase n=1 Tax=Sulfitobacter sp. 1A12126 TaxID=3368591 RepID=UPI00374660B6
MYYNGSTKWGLEFKRRFWEEDEDIYGGISYTDLAIGQISYPSTGYFSDGPAVLLGGYTWRGENSYKFNACSLMSAKTGCQNPPSVSG